MKIFAFLIFLCASSAFSQTDSTFKENTNIFPIWTFHDDSVNIHGVSLGIGTLYFNKRNTNTNGIKAELIGIGLFSIFASRTMASTDSNEFAIALRRPISERINGLNVSLTGTFCECITNGIVIGGVGQYNRQVNGISASFLINMTQIHNGIQIAILKNDSYIMNGLQIGMFFPYAGILNGVQIGAVNNAEAATGVQIGLWNQTTNLNGVQIGLWNINQDRSFPIFNWSF